MRKFNVEIEDTLFELEVEEYRQVPLIINAGDHRTWVESGHNQMMNAHSTVK